MPLPRLKQTPAELAEQRRKASRKRVKKLSKQHLNHGDFLQGSSTQSKTLYSEGVGHVDMEDDEIDRLGRALEEEQLGKQFELQEDYGHPTEYSTAGNNLQHVPRRWRSSPATPQSNPDLPVEVMDDAEYASWIRSGIYKTGRTVQIGDINFLVTDPEAVRARKREAEEYERRKKEKEEQRVREKKERQEQAMREKEDEERRKLRQEARENQLKVDAWHTYDESWKVLFSPAHPSRPPLGSLTFAHIPWPTFNTPDSPSALLSKDIETFIFAAPATEADLEKPPTLRDMLRPHFFRFHPDKFEAKVMPLVVDSKEEREKVREGAGVVMRCLNDMAEGKTFDKR